LILFRTDIAVKSLDDMNHFYSVAAVTTLQKGVGDLIFIQCRFALYKPISTVCVSIAPLTLGRPNHPN